MAWNFSPTSTPCSSDTDKNPPPGPAASRVGRGSFLKEPRRVCRPQAANQMQSIFARGVYLGENSSQSASVELVRPWRTNYARGRLQAFCPKRASPFLDSLKRLAAHPFVKRFFCKKNHHAQAWLLPWYSRITYRSLGCQSEPSKIMSSRSPFMKMLVIVSRSFLLFSRF